MKTIIFRTAQKKEFEALCRSQGFSLSEAMRQMVSKILNGQSTISEIIQAPPQAFPPPKGKTRIRRTRVFLDLTEKEHLVVKERAALSGFSVQRWITTLIRFQLTRNHTPLTREEIDRLSLRLYELQMIGRNLNQIARQLNRHELHPSQTELPSVLKETLQKVESEKSTLNEILSKNLDRW